ncbi:MAG: amidohydrolase family protein [Acidobacteriota bacterium]
MRRSAVILFGSAVLATGILPPAPAAEPGGEVGAAATLLSGAHVLSVTGDGWRDGVDVLVVADHIARIGPAGSLQTPADVRRVDLTGMYLLPGLIDLHTHLLLHPYDEAPWNEQVLTESLGLRTLRAGVAARATLRAGFTTVRELGTEGAGFADVGLRDAIEQGIIIGPRVLASTRAIVAGSSYGPSGFDPRWVLPMGAQPANGVAAVRGAVREQVAAGADWIKFYADYRRRPGAPSTPTFSMAEVEALVDEAHAAGLPVAAHASTDEGIRRAVMAGVQTIEHGSQASAGVLALMRRHDVVYCPTLAAAEAMARYGGWSPGEPEPARITEARGAFRRALAARVTIACGSDAGVFSHGDNAREIELMAAWGLAPVEALRAATTTAAAVIGRSADLGRVQAGYVADLIAVSTDPLADPSALRHPRLVMARGDVVVAPPAGAAASGRAGRVPQP